MEYKIDRSKISKEYPVFLVFFIFGLLWGFLFLPEDFIWHPFTEDNAVIASSYKQYCVFRHFLFALIGSFVYKMGYNFWIMGAIVTILGVLYGYNMYGSYSFPVETIYFLGMWVGPTIILDSIGGKLHG